MRRLLGVENAIFNIKPLTLKLGLSKETLNEAVTCEQNEADQLEMILRRWREAHKNIDDFAVLRKALGCLQPEGKNKLFRDDFLQESFLETESRISFPRGTYPRAEFIAMELNVSCRTEGPSIQCYSVAMLQNFVFRCPRKIKNLIKSKTSVNLK